MSEAGSTGTMRPSEALHTAARHAVRAQLEAWGLPYLFDDWTAGPDVGIARQHRTPAWTKRDRIVRCALGLRYAVESIAPESLPDDLEAARAVIVAAVGGASPLEPPQDDRHDSEEPPSAFESHLDVLVAYMYGAPAEIVNEVKARFAQEEEAWERSTLDPDAALDAALDAIADEIRSATADDLARVEPLMYRRVLSAAEEASRWEALKATWGVDARGFCYPLSVDPPQRTDLIAFDRNALLRAVGAYGWLRIGERLREGGVLNLLAIGGLGVPAHELDARKLLSAPPSDNYWTTADLSLLLYESHEGTITVGGRWLIDLVESIVGKDRDDLKAPWPGVS